MSRKRSGEAPGNAIIGQSGGPTVVINQSLVGAVLEARRHSKIGRFYGALHGAKGILNQEIVDLSREPRSNLESVAETPSAALGSVRMKPTEEDCEEMLRIMDRLGIRYFFYIGGNDSAETAEKLSRTARLKGSPLRTYHIPKTIDNDLIGTDHSPGYGSAAKFVAQAFMGESLDNRALGGVNINIVMGRHAGYLTAAAVLGRARPDSGPHLVYVPERFFHEDQFVHDVKRVIDRYGRCVIAVSEGIRSPEGHVISEGLIGGGDAFGNVQLSGSGALGDYLSKVLKSHLGAKLRVRAGTLGYLQRSYAGVVSKSDAHEARQAGRVAVQWAVKGVESGSISFIRAPGDRYRITYQRSPLSKVARGTRQMPSSFINRAGNDITMKFVRYARPLIGELPSVGFLKAERIKKV